MNGLPIFGLAPVIAVEPHEARLSIRSYNGVNGREAIYLGHDGGFTIAQFHLLGVDNTDLAVAESNWIILQTQATLSIMTDTIGRTWPNVIVRRFTPLEMIHYYGQPGWGRQYRAIIEHLI
jgi:hypothetical protein